MADQETVVGCMAVAQGPASITGSTEDRCADCAASIWVSPSSRAALAGGMRSRFVCVPCVCARLIRARKIELHPLTVAEISELQAEDPNRK